MIAVLAMRASDPIVGVCRAAAPVALWTPLGAPRWLGRAPGALGRFAQRRAPGEVSSPLVAVDAALRAWAGERGDRGFRAEFALRLAVDAWAAREVMRRRPRVIVAPSLAARRTFAAARAIGATCALVIDLPLLRALHRDLDRAAAAWPERRFLRRFRAPSWAIARQEAERVLADVVIVRGAYAHSLCVADGVAEERIATLAPRPVAIRAPLAPTGKVRLAGIATSRHGIDTALAAVRALGLTLVVRTGEGTEPAELGALPGVTLARGGAVDDDPVDAIVCPAICESYAPELAITAIPVVASPMASRDGQGPDPYDAAAFARALATPRVAAPVAPVLAPLLRALR